MAKLLVLVVDDDEDIVDFLTAALEAEGYEVLSALDSAALQLVVCQHVFDELLPLTTTYQIGLDGPLAADRHPAVILLDLMMPIMDGVEVSRRLRANPSTAAIPIIAMSAAERILSTAMVMNDHLSKPFRLSQLFEKVAYWAVAS